MNSDSDAYILITGGTININANGDGIDSNGYIGITGGSEIVAVGGSGMAQGFGYESTQCSAIRWIRNLTRLSSAHQT